jgi:DNA-binding NtrC family response regulator
MIDPHQASGPTPTVLFVDDETPILEGLASALRKEPYCVFTAASAAEGTEILRGRHIDIVVSDEQMPGVSGAEFLNWVRRRHPATVRIMLTGGANLESNMRVINEVQLYRFLSKPVSTEDLKRTLRQALQMKHLSEERARLFPGSKA